MIRAVRELNTELAVKAKNEIYITGYSYEVMQRWGFIKPFRNNH